MVMFSTEIYMFALKQLWSNRIQSTFNSLQVQMSDILTEQKKKRKKREILCQYAGNFTHGDFERTLNKSVSSREEKAINLLYVRCICVQTNDLYYEILLYGLWCQIIIIRLVCALGTNQNVVLLRLNGIDKVCQIHSPDASPWSAKPHIVILQCNRKQTRQYPWNKH